MNISSSKYDIFLVVPSDKNKSSISSLLQKTYDELKEKEISCDWMHSAKCLELKEPLDTLFVVDPFSGEAFQHLVKLGCRILGPLCILSCLQDGSNLPKRSRPIYSLNMRHVVVTFSSIHASLKKGLREKVLLMGGESPVNLTQSCTHLVVGSVGSEKYVTAVKLKLPVKLPEWIESCWKEAQKDNSEVLHCTDPYYNTYDCRPFYQQFVSASQLSSDERKEIQDLVTKNGGKYSGAMRAQETTHLVLETPTGSKFDHALQWGIKCMKKEWVYNSVAAGMMLDEEKYVLVTDKNVRQNKASTPKKDEQPFPAPNCSILVPSESTNRVNETFLSNVSFMIQPAAARLSSSEKKSFLAHCNMFLCGFNVVELTEIERSVKSAGGTVSKKFSKSVTHVLCANSKFVPKMLVDCSSAVHVVSQDWLNDCLNAQSCISENHYLLHANESSSSRGLNLSSITSKEPTEVEFVDFKLPEAKSNAIPSNNISNDVSEEKENIVQRRSDNIDVSADTSKPTNSTTLAEVNLFIFSEMDFVVLEPNIDDRNIVIEMLEQHGGTVRNSTDSLPENCVCICPALQVDVQTTPLTKIVRSSFWVQMCVELQTLLPVNQHRLFKPLRITLSDNPPLKGCVLAFSQFSGSNKDCLTVLATLLGAQCSEFFVRVANKEKGLSKNTHLILVSPEGQKYNAALKWGIPALHKEWLFEAAITREKPDETIFTVERQAPQLSEDDSITDLNVTANVSSKLADAESMTAVNISSAKVTKASTRDCKSMTDEKKDDPWVPNFDVSAAVEMVKSCSSSRIPGKWRQSMTLEELADLNFTQARRNLGIESPAQTLRPASPVLRPLTGILLCVSRKLQSQERNLHCITEKLGGRVLYSYDNSCTHLVHQGKSNEHIGPGSKEFRQALSHSKFIVSPEWLNACQETKSRMNEYEYPYNYNPRLSLSGQIKSEKVDTSMLMSPVSGKDTSFKKSPMKSPVSKVRSVRVSSSPIQFRKLSTASVSKVKSVSVSSSPAQSKEQRDSTSEMTPGTSSKESEISRQLKELMTASKKLLSTSPAQKVRPGFSDFVAHQPRHVPSGNPAPESQPSQSIPIMWEDPTEKEERERLARNPPPPRNEPETQDEQQQNVDCFLDVPTQKAPERKVFLLTSLKDANNSYVPRVIQKLGEEVVDAYHPRVTHLICENPSKNQKMLSSLAAGIWILHPSYIHASENASRFVEEEQYEWGSEAMKTEVHNLPSKIQALSSAPHVWRKHSLATGKRAFQHWEVMMDVPEHRYAAYETILRAGGANIVETFSHGSSLTKVAFLEGSFKLDIKVLMDQGAVCVKPEYFSAFLLDKAAPNPLLFSVTSRDSMKRKISSSKECEKKKSC